MYNEQEEYVCADKFAWRKLDNEVVILDTTSGSYYLLNETAGRIWELLIEKLSLEKICLNLIHEYDITKEKALDDIKKIINSFKKDGFIVSKTSLEKE